MQSAAAGAAPYGLQGWKKAREGERRNTSMCGGRKTEERDQLSPSLSLSFSGLLCLLDENETTTTTELLGGNSEAVFYALV